MKSLVLVKKSTSRFAKGASRFTLSVPIIASDVINWGVPESWVGTVQDFTPQASGKIVGLTKNVITSRFKVMEDALAKGEPARPIRQVAGFDPFEKKIGVRPEKQVMGEVAKERLVNRMLSAW